MFSNTRIFTAISSLATMQGDVRERVVVAMREISALGEHEFKDKILWQRILKLRKHTTQKGPLIINGNTIKDSFKNTADKSQNRTYEKHAREIFSIFIAITLDEAKN
jgi:hypothetical protein